MEELKIEYGISKQIKIISIINATLLLVTYLILGIRQVTTSNYSYLFYLSLVGIIFSVLLFLIVTVWQKPIIITIDNDEIDINLPNQKIDGSILWNDITQVGIGLSYITLTSEPTSYKIDLGNLKYNDLRKVKSKLIEICESRDIPFNNI